METLIIDNGAYELKAGWANGSCKHVTNALMRSRDRRAWMANDVSRCVDRTSLLVRRPVERGQVVSWELQKAIWDWTFDTHLVEPPEDFGETCLVLSEAPGTLPAVTVATDQIILEEYEFGMYRRTSPQALVAAQVTPGPPECSVVVDLGFTATQCVPVIGNDAVTPAIRRIDVGGNVLTNSLKETVSFRHYNMMEDAAILGPLKEQACYVAPDFAVELCKWRSNPTNFDFGFALPDHRSPEGRVLGSSEEIKQVRTDGEHQVLVLQNERFVVPEALFDPSQLGFDQSGLPEAIVQAVDAVPSADARAVMFANVVLTGGGALLPNLRNRLERELRSWIPEDYPLNVQVAENPIEAAWQGGRALSQRPDFQDLCITRQDYLEHGESLCVRKFGRLK